MSIDKVEVMNSQGNLLTLSLEDISNGYVVKNIDGLDPVKATLVSSDFATMDGQQEQSSSRETRNVVIQLGYDPDVSEGQTIRSLRSGLYQFFMAPSKVKMTFYMTDGLTVEATGTVESCEAPLFVQEPQMDISIVCFDPDFIESDSVDMYGVLTTTDTVPHSFMYEGTVKAGLTSIGFYVNQTVSDFTIYHTTPGGELRTMQVSAPLVVGDSVNICTIRGQKSITLTRNNVTTSLLWAVSPQSLWVRLEPGLNQLYLHASTTNPASVWLDYTNRYGGL